MQKGVKRGFFANLIFTFFEDFFKKELPEIHCVLLRPPRRLHKIVPSIIDANGAVQ